MNPFQMMEAFDQMKDALKDVTPDFLVNALAAQGIKFVLNAALEAGPPEGYAAQLKIDDATAIVLYKATLTAALTRKV